jgi:4,5-DOPA dioxygenase extradiol
VVQLSINADKDLDYHLELGAKLAALRSQGVLVIASGNVVHNLRAVDWKLADDGYEWARRFNEAAKVQLLSTPSEIATLDAHRDYRHAVPTPDHFLPLLYLAGLADVGADSVDILVDGYTYGSLSMTAYTLGLPAPPCNGHGSVGAPPSEVPADGSNM